MRQGRLRIFAGTRTRHEEVGMKTGAKAIYSKPLLVKHSNLKEITFDCVNWQCSVAVPKQP